MVKSDFDWLKGRIKYLLKYTGELSEINKGTYNPADYWTALKIIGLAYFASVYVRIISKQYFDKMYYIDLFAGSGLCGVPKENPQDFILGSPIAVTDNVRKTPFNKMFFCDNNPDFATALEGRMEWLKEQEEYRDTSYHIFQNDCNIAIDEIVEDIQSESKRPHYLAFVDPYGWNVKWETMEKLLDIPGDIIFTIQTFIMGTRGVGRTKFSLADEKTMNDFFGGDHWKDWQSRKGGLLEVYLEDNIRPKRKEIIPVTIKAKRKGAYNYDWVFATKKENPEWLRAIKTFEKRINKFTGDDVKQAIDEIKGRAKGLGAFVKKKKPQKTLEQFLNDSS